MPVSKDPAQFHGDATTSAALAGIPISSFPPPPNGLITIPHTATVAEAAKVLAVNNILSAPVVDTTLPEDSNWSDYYKGLVDMTDLLLFVCNNLEGSSKSHKETFLETIESVDDTSRTPVTEVLHVFKYAPFVALPADDTSTLLDAALILGRFGFHRLAVVKTGKREMVNFITQSSMIGALQRAAPSMPMIMNKRIGDMFPCHKIFQVSLDDLVWKALRTMRDREVSAVPITNDTGAIVGVFSNKDVRRVLQSRDLYPRVLSTLREFQASKVASEISTAHRHINIPSVSVTKDDTVQTALDKMAGLELHRVFIVDDDKRPVGVIALGDMLRLFAELPDSDYFGRFFD